MRIVCGIQDGKCQIPQSWLEKFKQARGYEPDTIVFDLSDNNPRVPAGVFLISKRQDREFIEDMRKEAGRVRLHEDLHPPIAY